jgi:hypothetical protein
MAFDPKPVVCRHGIDNRHMARSWDDADGHHFEMRRNWCLKCLGTIDAQAVRECVKAVNIDLAESKSLFPARR